MTAANECRVLVLTPIGRDGELTTAALQKAGIHAVSCGSLGQLCRLVLEGAAAVIVGEEVLSEDTVQSIAGSLSQLPAWSDLPFIVLTSGGRSTRLTVSHAQLMERLGHITLLERPLRIVTLVTAVRAGLRSRQRQYELRDRIEALRSSEVRFRSAFSRAAVGMAMLSLDGRFVEVNEALSDITGYTQAELLGTTANAITHPEDREASLAMHAQLMSGEAASMTREKRYIRKVGDSVWVRVSAASIRDDSGRPVSTITLVEEITYRRQAEEALAKQAAELARSNADLQQFAWVTSHDLREPIRTLIAFSQLLQLRYKGKLDQEADQSLEFIRNSARRMESLVGDLLTYSRVVNLEERPFQKVCLRSALDWAMSNLQASIEDSGALIRSEDLPEVMGEEVQIVQLLQNLLSNAIKYRGDQTPEIKISARREGKQYVICCQDNGVGIDPRYHERVFGLFKRLHGDEIQGTGLGLAICKKIVERHGGTMWVESKPGQGATFCFTLPGA